MYSAILDVFLDSYDEVITSDLSELLLKNQLLPATYVHEKENNREFIFDEVMQHLKLETHWIDSEEITDSDDFINLFKDLGRRLGVKGKLQQFKANLDIEERTASITFLRNGQQFSEKWVLDNHWIEQHLVVFMNRVFSVDSGKSLVIISEDRDQLCLTTIDTDKVELFNSVLSTEETRSNPDVVKTYKFVVSGILCGVGALLSTLLLWIFIGFLKGLLISVVIFLAVYLGSVIKHTFTAKAEKELNRLREEEPEKLGMMIANEFVAMSAEKNKGNAMGERLAKVVALNKKKIAGL